MPRLSRSLLSFFLVVLVAGMGASTARAQAFNCTVSVDYSRLSGNDFGFLEELKQRVTEYINQYAWTEDRFLNHERLDCRLQIIFEESLSLTSFRARLIVAARRPIYGTTQSSTVIQFNDGNWQFNYAQGGTIIHARERFDPFTSLLDFYAYLMLGYDYDTFGEMAGKPYFEEARRIAEIAQAQNATGWSVLGSERGRAMVVSELLDPRFVALRKAYFDYHLNGLDLFVTDPTQARINVLAALQSIEGLYDEVGRQFSIDLFFSAKAKELAAVFAGSAQGGDAFEVLTALDPSNLSEYNQLLR